MEHDLTAQTTTLEFELEPADNKRLANLCGQFDQNMHQLEERLGVTIGSRGNQFRISGPAELVERVAGILGELFRLTESERDQSGAGTHGGAGVGHGAGSGYGGW